MNDMDNKRPAAHKPMREAFKQWSLMTFYDRFELVVAVVLSLIVTLIISLALMQLIVRVVPLLVTGSLDPLDHSVFQSLFGMIMTVLIAMEFKHSGGSAKRQHCSGKNGGSYFTHRPRPQVCGS